MLTIQRAKTETVNPEPPPVIEHSLSNVYIDGPHTVVHVSSSLTGMLGLSLGMHNIFWYHFGIVRVCCRNGVLLLANLEFPLTKNQEDCFIFFRIIAENNLCGQQNLMILTYSILFIEIKSQS